MRYDPQIIRTLLLRAAKKASVELSFSNIGALSDEIHRSLPGKPIIPEKFLYEGLLLRVENAIKEGKDFIDIRKGDYMDILSQYNGFPDYGQAYAALSQSIHPVLQSCVGNWYYYARDNSERDIVLRSPVRIFEEEYEMYMNLVGKHRWFRGEIRYRSGGLYIVLLDEDEEKELFLVFQAGIFRGANILTGVLAGYSSSAIPVAGKAFLVRQDESSLENLSPKKFELDKSFDFPSSIEGRILRELKDFDGNYIRITKTLDFDEGSM